MNQNNDIIDIMKESDERHSRLREALGLAITTRKDNELLAKINWWFYSDEVLKEAGFTKHSMHGSANSSGIHAAMLDYPWLDLYDFMNHEEIHWVWGRKFGEAPAILNEGIAEYFQHILNPQQLNQLNDVRSVLETEGTGFLDTLANNDGFWKAYSTRFPVRKVAGLFTRYLVEHYSVEKVQDIFMNTYYEDNRLPEIIHSITSKSLIDIEMDILLKNDLNEYEWL